jgi:hypothetical protein
MKMNRQMIAARQHLILTLLLIQITSITSSPSQAARGLNVNDEPRAVTPSSPSRSTSLTIADFDWAGLNITLNDMIKVSKANSITQTTSSAVSFIASIVVVCLIYRSYARLSTTFNRLLLGISIADIMLSFCMMLNTLPAPAETSDYTWNPMGNVHSCDAQGFFLFLGLMGAPLYNCSLCLYYIAVVKYNKKEEYIRAKLEPFLHGVPIIFSLVGAITVLAMQSFNASSSYCWIAKDPPYCGQYFDSEGVEIEIPCRRGEASKTLLPIFIAFICIVLPIVIGTTMALIYLEVLKTEKKLSKYGVGSLRNLSINVVRNANSSDAKEQDGNNTNRSSVFTERL